MLLDSMRGITPIYFSPSLCLSYLSVIHVRNSCEKIFFQRSKTRNIIIRYCFIKLITNSTLTFLIYGTDYGVHNATYTVRLQLRSTIFHMNLYQQNVFE